MSRRSLIVLLTGLNLLLLAALVLTAYAPSTAYAQAAAAARRGDVMLIPARAEVSNDAVWMIDAGAKQLHVFRTTFPRVAGQPVNVRHVVSRDLARDFPNQGAAR